MWYNELMVKRSAIITGIAVVFGALLSSGIVFADDDASVDDVSIVVPTACTLSGTGTGTHTATINPGQYVADIGTTTLKALCNDANGFAIYATGYTGNTIGETNSNKLVGQNTNELVPTGIGTSGNSQWAMKLTTNPNATYPITIGSAPNTSGGADASFSVYHTVPNEYTKVAYRTAATDVGTVAIGSTLTTAYAANISSTQMADTYSGKVIYTLVHPNNAPAPVPVSKNLYYAITGAENNYTLTISDSDITSGAVASGPVAIDGYEFDEDEAASTTPWDPYAYQIKSVVVSGTVAPTSTVAWFAFLQNCESWDLSGLKTDNVTDMSYMFRFAGSNATSFTLDLFSWNTSKVTNMSNMFSDTGSQTTAWSVGDLSSWDTSNVMNMSRMFFQAGVNSSTFALDIASWDISSVTDMSEMFHYAGQYSSTFTMDLSFWNTSSVTNMLGTFDQAGSSATTWSIGDLSFWNTSSVTDMSRMFSNTGLDATTWSVGDLSSWNTSSVTDMSWMFSGTGNNATTWSVGDLSSWNTSNVTNMYSMFYGAGVSATTWSVGNISSWDTSDVTDMSWMFRNAGSSSSSFALNLSSWDTSSVTNMNQMFSYTGRSSSSFALNLSSWDTSSVKSMGSMFDNAGYSATTFSLDLSGWDTSSVTNMSYMFRFAGSNATSFTLDLSSWNTSKVTNMTNMFSGAGSSATTWSVIIPKTNNGTTTGSITNTASRLYGSSTSFYAFPSSDKSFTIAN